MSASYLLTAKELGFQFCGDESSGGCSTRSAFPGHSGSDTASRARFEVGGVIVTSYTETRHLFGNELAMFFLAVIHMANASLWKILSQFPALNF